MSQDFSGAQERFEKTMGVDDEDDENDTQKPRASARVSSTPSKSAPTGSGSVFSRKPVDLDDGAVLLEKWRREEHKLARIDLKRRGLDVAFAVSQKWEPLTAREMKRESGQDKGPVIALTCTNLDGTRAPHRRYRMVSKTRIRDANGGKRYTQRAGTGVIFDWHEPPKISPAFRRVIVITEGEIKAAILSTRLRARVLSVPGVSTPWKDGKRRQTIRQLFRLCKRKGCTLEMAYDSDAPDKPKGVMRWLLKLADDAAKAGIDVAIREILRLDGEEKTGPDDLIMEQGRQAYLDSPLHALTSKKVAEWRSTVNAISIAATDPDRPIVLLQGGKLHEYVAQCEAILKDTVYVRGGELVRVGVWKEMGDAPSKGPKIERSEKQYVIIGATREYIRRRLTKLVTFKKLPRSPFQPPHDVNCPEEVSNNIAGHGSWPKLRPLAAIATAPFIRPNFTVCTRDGYDRTSGIYLRQSGKFPKIPTRPTRRDAKAALSRLLEPFEEFPFDGKASRSVFAAHVLTCVARVTVPTSPIFFYTAPIAATGKTLLASCPSLIATGHDPAKRPFTWDEAELRKVLFASLLMGDSNLLFDNAPNGFQAKSATLCAFATAPTWSDRKLGVSETPEFLNRSVIVVTGNNVTPTSDLARRSIVCRLDVNAESARGRTFEIKDLIGHIHAHREELLAAALTIMRAYIVANRPSVDAQPTESFERWSQLVRDPLMWLGMTDAVASQETETDDDSSAVGEAFDVLYDTFKRTSFVAKDVVLSGPATDALAVAGCYEVTEPRSIGRWLGNHRGRVANGKKLVCDSVKSAGKNWRIAIVENGK